MTLPTESQWARYSALCARLRPLPALERDAALQALRATGQEDPQVLSLVVVHFALPPDADRMRTGERLGNFTLEEPLGAGGMGVVYRAQQHIGPTTRPVAVKLIHPALLATAREEALARFLAEMHTLVTLQHENIARIYDGGIYEDPRTHEQIPYLAMELVQGGVPLTTYARDYALSWQERLALFVRVCHAVRYAHEHRVVHRDLKPANVLVDSEGRPVVIDFGLAQACDAMLPGAHLAASGTPAYMSPEQVSDALGTITDKSDVYALGLMLYELLTDQYPYVLPRDGSFAQWRQVILEATPPPLWQYDEAYRGELEAIVAGALAKRPADRLPVAVLRSRLERYLNKLPPHIERPRPETSKAQQYATGMSSAPLMIRPDTPEAERRQLTVLACRVIGASPRSAPLDPEVLLEVVRDYQALCAEIVHRFEGHMAQYQGDRLVAYFGYPRAHEDDARRAVHTGLGIVEGMAALNSRLKHDWGVRLAVQVGIHTGVVVVEARGKDEREQLALGNTPTIAAQVQGLAAPDTVIMSPATLRLVEGYFDYRALGTHILDDPTEPLAVYQVLQESTAQSRIEVAVTKGLTPLVGREHEVGLLCERWAQVKDGLGQVVLLSGEGGIGKSRLVQALKESLVGEAHTRIEYYGSPYYQQSAFYPLVDHLQRLLRFRLDDPPEEKWRTLEDVLKLYDFSLEEAVPLLAAFLSLPPPAHYPPLLLTPQRQKQKTLETLLAWLLQETERQPVCFVMEDLHWMDPSTLEFLSLLIEQVPTVRMLMLLLFRPDFSPPWGVHSYLTHIALGRLSRRQVETMVEQITGGKALPAEVLQELVAKTDGVPLFVEELTKMVLESGLIKEREGRYELAGPLPPLAIPATLHDSLMARLDLLGTAKQIAQLGATLGREFAYEVLQAVAPVDEATLHKGLAQLVETELLYQRGLPPQPRYRFKHALIQDAAYQSLLRSTRQQYHQQIAQVLEERFPETRETQPELLAHHYTEASLGAQAIPYWRRAGQRAIERSANLEAISHLTKGLELLKTLPATPERAQQELTLQLTLGVSLSMLKGYTAPEVERAYSQALELCQYVGDSPQRFTVLIGLKRFYRSRAELKTAQELGVQLLELAQSIQDPAFLLQAYSTQGQTLFHLGEFTSALEHLEQAITPYDPQRHRPDALLHWHDWLPGDPAVACLSYIARTLWYLGYPDQALRRSHEALTLAKRFPHTYAMGTNLIAMLHRERREPQLVQELAEVAIALSSEHGFTRWLGAAMLWRGWALAEQGAVDEGIAQLHQGLTSWRAMGTEQTLPYYLAMLSDTYKRAGRAEEGLRVLGEALTAMHKSAERHYEAELYRLKGELLLQQALERKGSSTIQMGASMVTDEVESVWTSLTTPLQAEVEACFHQAIDVARSQRAKSLELRAVISLSCLWQQRGRRSEARQMLAGIYNWFTEGFDTPDLQKAKALLKELV